MPQSLSLQAHCSDEFSEAPRSASVDVTPMLAARIRSLSAILVAHLPNEYSAYLSVDNHAAEWTYAHARGEGLELDDDDRAKIAADDSELRTDSDRLKVSSSQFWFSSCLKNTNVQFSTDRFHIDALDDALINAPAAVEPEEEISESPAPAG